MDSNKLNRLLVLTGMILIAAFTRLIPHPPNFTAVAAMALFGGVYFERKSLAFAVPLIAMFLSDMIIGLHPGMYAVYLSFILIVMIGMSLRNRMKIRNILLASVSASVLFFIITNFAQWLSYPLYTKDAAGLITCYIAAIPFFHYTLLGDLFFTIAMFGLFEIIKIKLPQHVKVKI
jgi:hypothetical protein